MPGRDGRHTRARPPGQSNPTRRRRTPELVRRRRAFVIIVLVMMMMLALVLLYGSKGTSATLGKSSPSHTSPGGQSPASVEMPPAYLAWMPGGFPSTFRASVTSLPGVNQAVVVAGDVIWMTGSTGADGKVIDHPAASYKIPIDALAVDPQTYSPFLPASLRTKVTQTLSAGEAVIGTTSAKIRRLGAGGKLTFGGSSVTVGLVAPDDVVGWSELMVSRTEGARIGVTDDRYLLAQMSEHPSDTAFLALIHPLLTPGIPVRVAAPGEVRYVRVASGSAPPVVQKAVFGEFSAYPDPGNLEQLHIDPAWITAHLKTEDVPLLGQETCNIAFFPALIGAMHQLQREGLGSLVKSNAGCYNPELLAAKMTAPPAFHAYGAAIDINAPENPFGATPTQDPRLVAVMKRWGFNWGGDFLVPDGMHFEYLDQPPAGG